MTCRHDDQRLDPITKPVYQVSGVRRVGPQRVYATVASSLAQTLESEVLAEQPGWNKFECDAVAFEAMTAAALAVGPDHPLRSEILALRNRIA